MIKTNRKRRAPIRQLHEASKVARQMLIDKRIDSKDNLLQRLSQMPNAPKLPGLPPYLPRKYTLDWARVVMTIIVKKWLDANKGKAGKKRQENIREFMVFAIRRLEDEERKWTLRLRSTNLEEVEGETIAKIFAPMQAKETAERLKIFIVDMFNKSNIITQNGTVSEFLDEFDADTLKMMDLWKKNDNKK